MAGLLLLLRPLAHAASPKPNILFAVADDWSFGQAGAYHCAWIKTPAFDRIAGHGLLFNEAFTPCGKCAPSRACILTGRNPWQLKAAANHWCFFPPEFKSVVEALGQHGYFTGMTGKGWAPGIALDAEGLLRQMTGQPFDKRTAPPLTKYFSPDDYTANFADFLDAAPKDKPWFFWYGCREPHRPYEYGSGVAKGGMKTSDIGQVPACWPDNGQVRNDMLDYGFAVEHYDDHLGWMLAELEKRGLLDNTIVIATSDNGMPFPHDKGYAYYNSDHLPLAIMWRAGIRAPGRVVDDYVSFIDFAPTFLDVAGLPWSESGMAPITGRSLMEIFKSDKSGRIDPRRDHVLIGRERNDVGRPHDEGYPVRGIIKDGMLYVHNFEPSRWPAGNPETGYQDTDSSPTKTAVLVTRFIPAQKHFWDICFGKLPADQLFDVRRDPDCVSNLAATSSFGALHQELYEALTEQEDPRMSGKGAIFDKYPDAAPERGFYERFMHGEKFDGSIFNKSDFQKPAPGAD